ncbi:hypothetical protein SAMN04487761_1257 [Lachnospiraceae bacterium C7]|nr:hypothetical protein SAMN04487761_1257 [Lachnospiraceae bacterium C7]
MFLDKYKNPEAYIQKRLEQEKKEKEKKERKKKGALNDFEKEYLEYMYLKGGEDFWK